MTIWKCLRGQNNLFALTHAALFAQALKFRAVKFCRPCRPTMPAKAVANDKADKPQFLIDYAADKDPVSVKKANMEMQEIFNDWKMFDSPQIVQCDAIIPDYNNRGGSTIGFAIPPL